MNEAESGVSEIIKTAVNVRDLASIEDARDLEVENAEEKVAQHHHQDTTRTTVSQDDVSLLSTGMCHLQALNTLLRYSTKLCRQLVRFLLI